MYLYNHEHLFARMSPDWYTRWPSSSSSTEGARGLYSGRRYRYQRVPSEWTQFGTPVFASARFGNVVRRGRAGSGVVYPGALSGRRWSPMVASSVQCPGKGGAEGVSKSRVVNRSHRRVCVIHRHHHPPPRNPGDETRVTRGREHVCKHGTNVRVCRWG